MAPGATVQGVVHRATPRDGHTPDEQSRSSTNITIAIDKAVLPGSSPQMAAHIMDDSSNIDIFDGDVFGMVTEAGKDHPAPTVGSPAEMGAEDRRDVRAERGRPATVEVLRVHHPLV